MCCTWELLKNAIYSKTKEDHTVHFHQHFESRGTIYSYFEIGLKPAVVGCLTNAIAPPPIAQESCSRAQTDRPVFWIALEKSFVVGGCGFFVTDIIGEVVLWVILAHVTWPRFWMMRQSTGCSIPTPRYSAAWQWTERTGSNNYDEAASACVL